MYSLLDRFQGGLWGMTIGQDLVSLPEPEPQLQTYLSYIPQVMLGHVTVLELLSALSAGTFSRTDWSFYGTLSLVISGDLTPTSHSYEAWSQKKVVLNEAVLSWAMGCIDQRASLVLVAETLNSLELSPREAAIVLAIYGALSLPGDWTLAFDRLIGISPAPHWTAPLLGCLLGIQGTTRAIPPELRLRYATQGEEASIKAEKMVRSWSGSVGGAIVTSPRRIHLG
jgi:hypothetical protein